MQCPITKTVWHLKIKGTNQAKKNPKEVSKYFWDPKMFNLAVFSMPLEWKKGNLISFLIIKHYQTCEMNIYFWFWLSFYFFTFLSYRHFSPPPSDNKTSLLTQTPRIIQAKLTSPHLPNFYMTKPCLLYTSDAADEVY